MTSSTMEIKSEFSSICRICLQDGELYSIFHKTDDSELNYSEKIMQCTNIEVKKDQALPEQICSSCIMDLEASYRFKMNCESSDAILQTYVVSNVSGSVDEEEEEEEEEECTEDEESDNYADESDLYNYKASMYDENGALIAGDDIKKEKGADDYGDYGVRKGASNEIGEVSTRTKKDGTKETIVRLKRAIKGSVDDKQPKIHICEICANTYKYRHALEVHMRRHRGDKPYNCEHCDRRFVIRFELKRHMRTHTGQKPYGCRFCERKFSDFGSRIKHERSHTGERPYVCQTCGKTFAYSHVLSGHMLTHTGEKRHQCNQCGKRFTKSHHLKSHLNTHLKALNKSVGGGNVNNQQQQMPSSSMMQQQQQQRPPNMLEPMKHELHVQDEQELLNVVHGVMHGGGFQVITEKY